MNDHTVDSSLLAEPTAADVLVIGGGLAGLTAATHAARTASRVVLLDASATPGGRARTTERDGVRLNEGPHALYESGAGMRVLHELGIDPPGGRPRTTGRAVWRDRPGRLPFDPRSLLTTRLLRPRERAAFARFHLGLGRIDARSLDSVTVADFLDDAVGPPGTALRALVEGLVRLSLYADAPGLHSAGAAVDQLVLAGAGVRYLHGGWGTLVDALAATARQAGADLVPSTRVDRLEPTAEGWTIVDATSRRWSARTAVLAGLSPEAAGRIADDGHGSLAAQLRQAAGPAVRAACLDLVVASPPQTTFALDLDHHGYYSLHAPVADLASDGRALVSLARYRRPDEITDADHDRATLRAFARRMGVATTLAERYLHDMTVTHGMPLASRGGLVGRPDADALGRDGLFLAGDWVGPTGLLADAALASGSVAGRLAADRSRSHTAR